MKTFTLAILASLMLATNCLAIDIGSQIDLDKRMHAMLGYIGADVLEDKVGLSSTDSFVLVLWLGVVKEAIDVEHGGRFDWGDVLANNLGWGVYRLELPNKMF